MDARTRKSLDDLHLKDRNLRYAAFQFVLETTKEHVDWAYDAWDDLLKMLEDGDNHQRAIAVQVLANLAKSDPKGRMVKALDALIAVTHDEKFVTARHSLMCLWKVAAAGKKLQKMVVERLSERFASCAAERNCTLIRHDIIQVFQRLHAAVNDPKVKEKALALIETETDPKYRKKYAGLWRTRVKEA